MAKSTDLPTTVTLMRFGINPNKLPKEFEIWTLDFPFDREVRQFKTTVEQRINEKRNVPYRQLNNALIAVCPSLTHGFENAGKDNPYRALAVGVPAAPAQLPNLEHVQHIIREWAQIWTQHSDITKKIPKDELVTMRGKLITAINAPLSNWTWKRMPANRLLNSFNPNESLNYTALPSLMAALLHGQVSAIHGKQIQWRKVQDNDCKKWSVVGFVSHRPIWIRYAIDEYKMKKSGEGFGSYKLEFHLETQTGRDTPWMFVSLHAQRYVCEALTDPNHRRRVSVLTAANRAKLDDFRTDTTLVKLRASENKENVFKWDDNLVELLERIGAIPLETPNNILAIPQKYWHPSGLVPDYGNDEYYIVHAEGYCYGDNKAEHQLEAGFSTTDSATVYEQVVEKHLTMLERDKPLETDNRPFSNVKTPRAMRDFQFMSKPERLKPGEMAKMIQRALRGQEMLVAILWNTEDTRDGIFLALREVFLLKAHDTFPSNITIINKRVGPALLETIDKENFNSSYKQRIRDWKGFLQSCLPKPSNCFAIIEMLKSSWKVKDVARTACVQEGITSQMVRSIRLKLDESGQQAYLGGQDNHKHRANSVAREVVLRHIGGMYGDPQEIYQVAGAKDKNLEVIAFFLKQTQGNISYPIAVKLAFDGAVEVMLPDQKEWILYGNASPKLGQIFAKERVNVTYHGSKRKIRDNKKKASALYYEKSELSSFILKVLKNLQHPTIVLIEADKWRFYNVWPQLRNLDMLENWNVLNFDPYDRVYERNDPQFNNLLAVIRMRSERETPQYLTDTRREFTQLTGAIDIATGDLMHYFSIGRQLVSGRGQRHPSTRHATMLDGVGAGVAYKYPQIVEFVPFLVREDYQSLDCLKQLCRIPHFLRISPAWPQGNIVSPYPMHLARQLVDDQLCILGMES